MADVIRLRRGTAAQWTTKDPVLGAGEPGFETDTGLHKIGNGELAWSDLPYFLDEPGLETWYATHPPTVTPGGLVTNVKDSRFGAVGDGEHDDTAAIQQALDETADGGICFLPPGTYLVGSATPSILTGRPGVTLVGAGCAASVVEVAPTSTATRVLNLSRASDSGVRDVGFDAAGNAVVLSGVWASALNGQRNLWVRGCRFTGFMPGSTSATHAAVYVWTSDGVHVADNQFVDCGRAITVDQPDGAARVVGNQVSAGEPGIMATGILVRRASGASEGEVEVSGNRVTGARNDPGGVGAEGHGIAVFRCRDVQVAQNHVEDNGRGILVSNQSFGAVVQGNTCVGNHDAGIRCEPEITAQDVGVGAGAPRGVTVIGNVSRNNASVGSPSGANTGIGIVLSYAAGSVVSGNVVHDNSGDGIACDSDRVTIAGNVVFNNWSGYTTDPTNGKRGGIRIYAATGCVVVGNQCYDNKASKTQQYGLSLSQPGGAHLVLNNNLAGNGTGEIFGADRVVTGFFGASPVTRRPNPGTANLINAPDVLNNLVQSLRELGLIT